MKLSARNQLKGTVKKVSTGAVMADVEVDVGGQEVFAAITRASVENLGVGQPTVAVVLGPAREEARTSG
jgi:molybdate transport system regulatory protein